MGEKCKIDSDEYKNLLSYYREQAKQIHGDNIALWKEKQYWRRLEKQRNIYRKRRNMNEYIDRQTAERINSYEIGCCPFWRTRALPCSTFSLYSADMAASGCSLSRQRTKPTPSLIFISNADGEVLKKC